MFLVGYDNVDSKIVFRLIYVYEYACLQTSNISFISCFSVTTSTDKCFSTI